MGGVSGEGTRKDLTSDKSVITMHDMSDLGAKSTSHRAGSPPQRDASEAVVRPILLRQDAAPEARLEPRFDAPRLERAVREILFAIGENPEREGLRDTPARVARAYRELFAGLGEDGGRHLRRSFEHAGEELVLLRDITFSSVCEHHLLPFFGRAHLAYLPGGGRVVGLSKLARTVESFARRPQLQERLGAQIADALVEQGGALGATVVLEAEHLCLRVRGARSPAAAMKTVTHRGLFAEDATLRQEVLAALQH